VTTFYLCRNRNTFAERRDVGKSSLAYDDDTCSVNVSSFPLNCQSHCIEEGRCLLLFLFNLTKQYLELTNLQRQWLVPLAL